MLHTVTCKSLCIQCGLLLGMCALNGYYSHPLYDGVVLGTSHNQKAWSCSTTRLNRNIWTVNSSSSFVTLFLYYFYNNYVSAIQSENEPLCFSTTSFNSNFFFLKSHGSSPLLCFWITFSYPPPHCAICIHFITTSCSCLVPRWNIRCWDLLL